MTSSGPTKNCPRCNAVLPAQATFCGACGWQFSAPASPAGAPAGGQPTIQAPVQPQQPAMPGYPLPGQPDAASYAPVAVAPAPRRGISIQLLAIILIAAVLTIGIPGYLIFDGHGGSGLLVDRHGLPSNVPLPSGATFKLFHDLSNSSGVEKDWYWTVASPNDPASVQTYYQTNLASNGWTHLRLRGSDGDYEVTGCQGHQGIYVAMNGSIEVTDAQGSDPHTIPAPAGGSALEILVGSQPDTVSYAECS